VTLYELRVEDLEGRHFSGLVLDDAAGQSSAPDGRGRYRQCAGHDGLGAGRSMMYKDDTFLASANLCRWIIDFSEVQIGKQVGMGSYGVVYRGKWKGVEVAVKRFIKQKLDERRMLEFRAEMAFLSELHHPNIVLFIGTSFLCQLY
jgi:serine/threonine protein kinase